MITEVKLACDSLSIPIQIIRSDRKTMTIEVKEDLTVRARIPGKISDKILMEFLEKHKKWILNKYRQAENLESRKKEHPAVELSAEEKKKIREKIVHRVEYYEHKMGLSVSRITIRNQKTRWGSCSSKGNVNFNYKLAYMPEEILDYVIVHELSHLRHMNHSKEFWRQVEEYLPDYKIRRNWLKEHGREY